ncbi:rhamnulokinase family protein [Paenibacillus sp. MMS20-IR301]|uniref:rhamnulokinase n=1 Tax=Paenibacillus sp. MMS20-IR301 TaxID=2895946 RepID=UPI0028E20C58|nr:rhamnulokinase family protein [Paenibacillus sp. MMS20-IR301]WNS44243.1 rhamnulokinase family protein [Paenibacillus sp. MMS20-IR301]
MRIIKLLAVDLGASSGRVMLGTYAEGRVAVEEIRRFPNLPVEADGHLYWNVPQLFQEIKLGIKAAVDSHGPLEAMSVDTWGVDYGFLDEHGELLGLPHHYRDQRMEAIASRLEAALPPEEQFRLTGNQSGTINTVYQLYADLQGDPGLRAGAGLLLMMPDLFHYMLSGMAAAEQTIWSTSGLLQPDSAAPALEVLRRLELPAELIPRLVPAGTVLGELRPELQAELGTGPLKVIAGASHDTAAAVASIPYGSDSGPDGFGGSRGIRPEMSQGRSPMHSTAGAAAPAGSAAFISCGTWSLAGLETAEPVLSAEACSYGFTNESCFRGTNRLLKNITGLWLLQETQRGWAEAGEPLSHQEAAALAANLDRSTARVAILDPNDPVFSTPGNMPLRIESYCLRTGQPVPQTKAEIIRTILESLAEAYAGTIRELELLTGTPVSCIHMVGGGIQNTLLCQLTADATGKEVIAGPVEASATGNIVVQLAALGVIAAADARSIVERSCAPVSYLPASSTIHSNQGGQL